ncbi:hypothetical protein EJ02DRAFT_421800 [Clathrospora elynae]|uniref:Heterokaryon incompatibility domain-containing protein n=1 Tax=Clathrospora elynae TaxID=706981 RepID=A0A6A5T112_9PLEO|nr:hypothetical protein EJ02DRAFT_421800 [Clathrospora elynae]
MSSAEEILGVFMLSQTATSTYPGGGSWYSALWRTMIGDLVMTEFPIERARTTHEADFKMLWRKLSRQEGGMHSNILFESLCGMTPNHAFFITKMGYMGIGPPHMAPGDQVWFLYGGKVPFIMRKTESQNVNDGRHKLHIVGDAYVHGVMDGEAVADGHQAHNIWIY